MRYERLGILDRLEIRLRRVPSGADAVDTTLDIPPDIAARLIKDNPKEPLWRHFRQYGKGRPGVTQETELYTYIWRMRLHEALGQSLTP